MTSPIGDVDEGVASAAGIRPPTVGAPPQLTGDHLPKKRKEGTDQKEAKWSPGRGRVVRGPELWKERLQDPNRPAFRSGWQDVDLVWRVLRVLVVKLDLGGMEPIIAQALSLWRMNPRVKNMSEYVEAVIPFYERVDLLARVPDQGTARGGDHRGVFPSQAGTATGG